MKDKRAAGMLLFDSKPLKGVRLLQSAGIVGESAVDVAEWIRKNIHVLDRSAVGDLFGLSDAFAVAIMHAYIDLVRPFLLYICVMNSTCASSATNFSTFACMGTCLHGKCAQQ